MCNIDCLHASNRTVETKRALQAARANGWIACKNGDFWLPVVLFAAAGFTIVKFGQGVDLIAKHRGVLKAALLGCLLHLRLQLSRQCTALRAKETEESVDIASITLLAN